MHKIKSNHIQGFCRSRARQQHGAMFEQQHRSRARQQCIAAFRQQHKLGVGISMGLSSDSTIDLGVDGNAGLCSGANMDWGHITGYTPQFCSRPPPISDSPLDYWQDEWNRPGGRICDAPALTSAFFRESNRHFSPQRCLIDGSEPVPYSLLQTFLKGMKRLLD